MSRKARQVTAEQWELILLPIELLRKRIADAGPRDKTVQTKFTIGTAQMIVDAADEAGITRPQIEEEIWK